MPPPLGRSHLYGDKQRYHQTCIRFAVRQLTAYFTADGLFLLRAAKACSTTSYSVYTFLPVKALAMTAQEWPLES